MVPKLQPSLLLRPSRERPNSIFIFLPFFSSIHLPASTPAMDRRLYNATLKGDVAAFLKHVQDDEKALDQTTLQSQNTTLHLASRLGHFELVSEIVRLRPQMVWAENKRMETPLHEASRQGHVEVLRLLFETCPWAAHKLNSDNESVLFVGCSRGQLNVVKYLLSQDPQMFVSEEDGSSTPLHVAASMGYTDIVHEILKVRPDFALKLDSNGLSPLHLASSKGYLDITKELLAINGDLGSIRDTAGRTPLHSAAIKGHILVLSEILLTNPDSICNLTKQGETVLHLSVKSKQYEVVEYLVENIDILEFLNLPDKNGNTALHLAAIGKLSEIMECLIHKTEVKVNTLNCNGYTPLDIVEQVVAGPESPNTLRLKGMLERVGGKRSSELLPEPQLGRFLENNLIRRSSSPKRINRSPLNSPRRSRLNHPRKQVEPFNGMPRVPEADQAAEDTGNSSKIDPKSITKTSGQPTLTQETNKCQSGQNGQFEFHNEGLRNARNTIIVVASLITTVTFTAGTNPPGGVYQDGPGAGKSIMGKTTAFKVFMVSNHIALFWSVVIVTILVSVIPFRRKAMMRLLTTTHKIMWITLSFMAMAYVAAICVTMPQSRGTRWVTVISLSIGGGSLGSIFLWLGVLLTRHLQRKLELKRERKSKEASHGNSWDSDDSDLVSSKASGYHTY